MLDRLDIARPLGYHRVMSNTSETPKGTRKLAGSIKSVALESRDAGYGHETNDCLVKALAAVTGVPYRDAHQFCKDKLGRGDRQGTMVYGLLHIAKMKTTIYGFRIFEKPGSSPLIRQASGSSGLTATGVLSSMARFTITGKRVHG
jgi:hypothetical protein